jgi:hypothetical protein
MADELDLKSDAGDNPLAVVVAAEIAQFRAARLRSPIVSRTLEFAARCDLPPYLAWLMAANFFMDENDRLREQLKAQAASLHLDADAAQPRPRGKREQTPRPSL